MPIPMNHPAETIACPLCSEKHPGINILPYPLFRHMDFSIFHPGPNRIGRCRRCGLVFRIIDDGGQQEIDAIYRSEDYLKHEEPHTLVLDGQEEPVPMSRIQAGILSPFLNVKTASVLDIGCFDGQLLSEIGKVCDASDLCGFDVGERPQFPRRKPFRFVSGRVAEINGSFDMIIMSHSIQYIRDIHSLFEDIRKLLKPDGKIFIQAPDFSAKPASLLLGDLYYHYTREIIDNILRYMGFQSRFLEIDYFPRDILVIASPGVPASSGCAVTDDDLGAGLSQLAELAGRLERLVTSEVVSVLGTTIDAAFVDQCLGSRVAFFVDENPRKVGKTFHGKPVVHPRSVADNDVVAIPMGATGEAIRDRLSRQYPGSYQCV